MVETLVTALAAYLWGRLRGVLDRRVDAALEAALAAIKRNAAGDPQAEAAIDMFTERPSRRNSRRLVSELTKLIQTNPEIAGELREHLDVVDQEVVIDWVAQRTGIERETVVAVLDLMDEHMTSRGIIDDPGRQLNFYERRASPLLVVDTDQLAHDAEKFHGIDSGVALAILDAEYDYLVRRGIAPPF